MARFHGRQRGRWRSAVGSVLLVAALLAPAATASADTGVIAGADDGVRLRADPGFDGAVVGTLWDGTAVDLRIDEADTVLDPDGETRWWPVATELGDGWVAGAFLRIDGWDTGAVAAPASDGGDAAATAPAGDGWDGPDLTWSSTARVAESDGVNLRAEPGSVGAVLDALAQGEVVDLREGASTVWADGMRWWPVNVDGVDGWVAGPYLEAADAAAAPDDGGDWVVSEEPARSGDGASFAGMGWATVATDDGSGLNLRADAAPDAERVGQAFEGDLVELLDGPVSDPLGNAWYLVEDGGVTGWAFGDYLSPGDEPAAAPARAGRASGSFMYPVSDFQFTQGFGCSQYWWFYAYDPWAGCHVHDGIDLAAPWYTDVVASDGGIVEQAGWCDCGLGWYVKLDHLNGYKTTYGHLAESPLVAPGQAVAKGDHIGEMGSTGSSTGSHLHFSVEYRGSKVDPLAYLP
jgi:hypothetical protein